MKNLISMTDFVLEFGKESNRCNYEQAYDKISTYANFLKQALELWMFVPCDEEGRILEEKSFFASKDKDYIFESDTFDKYQQAKERCLFEGFFNTTESPQYKMYIQNGMQAVFYIARKSNTLKNIFGTRTIEDLIKENPVYLTKTALKQIGL